MVALTGTQKVSSESAQADTPPAAARLAGPNPVKLVHFAAPAIMPPLLPNQLAAPNLSPLPQQAAPPPAAAPQPAFVPPPRPALVLADDEIATLVKRGQDLLQNGDLASARLLLRRAAEAGNANAALALAASFDPLVIARLGVIGIQPDIARARQWYAKAAELGSTDASQQLAKLERER
jgi:hypothetical protein